MLAKAPIPGYAKTRLIPALGAAGAAELQAYLLARIVGDLLTAEICPVTLCCDPDTRFPEFEVLERSGATLTVQVGRDLGERMSHAVSAAFDNAERVVVVGTDVPALNAAYVERAIRLLAKGSDAVLGPVEDGGYCLLGLRAPHPAVFADIPWSTPAVAELTRDRFRKLGLRWSELPALWDVDTPSDLPRLAPWLPTCASPGLSQLLAGLAGADAGQPEP